MATRDTILLYHLYPFCGLEDDRRAWLKLPPEIRNIRLVDVKKTIARALPPKSSWYGRRVGITRWVGPERFIAELANEEGDYITDSIAGGAVVAASLTRYARATLLQLNPTGFVASWRLLIPQATTTDSEAMLKASQCKINDSLNMMSCDDFRRDPDVHINELDSEQIRHLCEGELTNESVCSPGAADLHQWRRGPYVLICRRDETGFTKIFLTEVDAPEKSK